MIKINNRIGLHESIMQKLNNSKSLNERAEMNVKKIEYMELNELLASLRENIEYDINPDLEYFRIITGLDHGKAYIDIEAKDEDELSFFDGFSVDDILNMKEKDITEYGLDKNDVEDLKGKILIEQDNITKRIIPDIARKWGFRKAKVEESIDDTQTYRGYKIVFHPGYNMWTNMRNYYKVYAPKGYLVGGTHTLEGAKEMIDNRIDDAVDESLNEGLSDIERDFENAKRIWNSFGFKYTDLPSAVDYYNRKSPNAEPSMFYAKPLYDNEAWDEMRELVAEWEENDNMNESFKVIHKTDMDDVSQQLSDYFFDKNLIFDGRTEKSFDGDWDYLEFDLYDRDGDYEVYGTIKDNGSKGDELNVEIPGSETIAVENIEELIKVLENALGIE